MNYLFGREGRYAHYRWCCKCLHRYDDYSTYGCTDEYFCYRCMDLGWWLIVWWNISSDSSGSTRTTVDAVSTLHAHAAHGVATAGGSSMTQSDYYYLFGEVHRAGVCIQCTQQRYLRTCNRCFNKGWWLPYYFGCR